MEDITYALTIDTLGCISYDEITIYVEVAGEVFVPNLFTPNADGLNDVLEIFGNSIDYLDFKIFDRWGEMVFQTDNINDVWDGTFNGMPLNSAILFIQLRWFILMVERIFNKVILH